jgi:acetolactate synthase-1/3 small subunit
MKHTIVALVEDKPGVLNRVASMFRRRGFNIESLAVGHTEIANLSRMTIVVDGAQSPVEQVTKQLYKLVDVVKVSDISEDELVSRELALIKVRAPATSRNEILQIVEVFRAGIVDVAGDSMIVEVTGTEDKIEAITSLLRGFGIKELVRTGRIALVRGASGTPLTEEENGPVPIGATGHRGRRRAKDG